jgi:hypothetical protein
MTPEEGRKEGEGEEGEEDVQYLRYGTTPHMPVPSYSSVAIHDPKKEHTRIQQVYSVVLQLSDLHPP